MLHRVEDVRHIRLAQCDNLIVCPGPPLPGGHCHWFRLVEVRICQDRQGVVLAISVPERVWFFPNLCARKGRVLKCHLICLYLWAVFSFSLLIIFFLLFNVAILHLEEVDHIYPHNRFFQNILYQKITRESLKLTL